ncbi:hypothetical protein Hamer_G016438 [Homarus americanus]|uniref:Uncharacterized protein n=1 Tax=Homarus americanus TaxID=6706 RepID=A0A8J5N7F0_HOMAM|nr:hypothetical protein Hamer_G016438 [Homarus americanus]
MTTEACARAITQTEAILREWNTRSERTLRELNELSKAQTEVILKALRNEETKIRKGTIGIEIRNQLPLALMDTEAWLTTDSSSSSVRALEDGNLPQLTPLDEADGEQSRRQEVLYDDRHQMQVGLNHGLAESPQQGEPEHPVPFSPNKVLQQICLLRRDAPVRPTGGEVSATSRNQNSTEGTAVWQGRPIPSLMYSGYRFNTATSESHKLSALLLAGMSEDLKMALESCEHFCPQKGYERALALLSRRFGGERG